MLTLYIVEEATLMINAPNSDLFTTKFTNTAQIKIGTNYITVCNVYYKVILIFLGKSKCYMLYEYFNMLDIFYNTNKHYNNISYRLSAPETVLFACNGPWAKLS